jgi:hypothetical protein
MIVLSLAIFSCSPKFQIQTEYPNKGDFNNYKTFKFYNPANMPATNFSFEDSDKKMIFDAISDQMKARGYTSVQDADIIIKVQGGTKSTIEIKNDNRAYYPYNNNFYNNNYYNGYNRYGMYDDPYNSRRDQSKKETSFIIDVIDARNDKIVWQGVGLGVLGKKQTLTAEEINEAITLIFTEYPQKDLAAKR